MTRLTNKVAIVTGASKGIGAEAARALAAAGAAVVVNYASSREGADRVVDDIRKAGGRALAVGGSVARAADVEAIFAAAKAEFGHVDILVNNAGVYEMLPLSDVTEETYRRQFDTNVLGILLASQAAAAQFGDAGGSIINISSVVSRITPPGTAVYAGTKGAVDAINGVLARELGPRGIRVNAVNPGLVLTEGTRTVGIAGSEFEDNVTKGTPLGRVGLPDDIAPVIVFLASDEAKWVTGQRIEVAGGY